MRESMWQKKCQVADGGERYKSDQPTAETAPEAGEGSSPDFPIPNRAQCAGDHRKDRCKYPDSSLPEKDYPEAPDCNSEFQTQAPRLQGVGLVAGPTQDGEGINKQGCRSERNCNRCPAHTRCELVREQATHEKD